MHPTGHAGRVLTAIAVAGGGVAGQDPPCDQTSCSSKALSTARVRSRTPSLLRVSGRCLRATGARVRERPARSAGERQGVVSGKGVEGRLNLGGRRTINKKKKIALKLK